MLLLKSGDNAQALNKNNMTWLFLLLLLVTISIGLMRFAGPAVVSVLGDQDYRALRDTLPWKYIGFVIGGTFLISSIMTVVDRHFSWLRLFIALVATLLIAMFYDLPFDNLVLPPNGDV